MKTHNANNERQKREYLVYLKEAKRYSEVSLDGVVKALHRFEVYTQFKDFRQFHTQQAVGFKAHLAKQVSERTAEPLSKATLYSTLAALKNFFTWLAGRPGFRSRLTYAHADYFNLSEKESRVAKARRDPKCPTIEQIRHCIAHMPTLTEIDRRNRALMAFVLLTGARDGAVASLALKHIDLLEGKVDQDARQVKTKFSKSFLTYFFLVGDDIRQIVVDWVGYLRTEKLWGNDDPLFPATKVQVGAGGSFEAAGLDRKFWSSAAPIRKVFQEAFAGAGLPYFNPHSFRNTLVALGEQRCQTPEEFKAWSQNLGHEKVLTTLTSYGDVAKGRQREIIGRLGRPAVDKQELGELLRQLQRAVG